MELDTGADRSVAPVTLCVLLWARPGRERDLIAYEDDVLELLADHGGRLLERVRTRAAHRSDDVPLEVQLIEFVDDDALDRYLADDRRVAMAARRDAAIARTEVLPVDR